MIFTAIIPRTERVLLWLPCICTPSHNWLRTCLSVSNHPHITCYAGQYCQTIIHPASLEGSCKQLRHYQWWVPCTRYICILYGVYKYHVLVQKLVGVAGLRVSVLLAVPTKIFGVCTGPIQLTWNGPRINWMPAIICIKLICSVQIESEFVGTADPTPREHLSYDVGLEIPLWNIGQLHYNAETVAYLTFFSEPLNILPSRSTLSPCYQNVSSIEDEESLCAKSPNLDSWCLHSLTTTSFPIIYC